MANETKVSWAAPTKRADGSAYTAADHAGYLLQIGSYRITVTGAVTSYNLASNPEVAKLASGTYPVTVYTIDKHGVQSAPSETKTLTVVASPNAPTQVTLS